MLEKKAMALSDIDATNFDLEQEGLADSWGSYGRQEHGRKQRALPVSSGRRRPRSTTASTNSNGHLPLFSETSFAASAAAAVLPSMETTTAYAGIPSVASVASAAQGSETYPDSHEDLNAEYPQTVQELVMNGFELKKVVRAFELVGDNFDDLLAFLLSSSKNG
jgi:hypothetical protein